MTHSYEDLINQFLYQQLPTDSVNEDVRFESISAEIFSTKQRRNGPMPKPEAQVKIREIIRQSKREITFFLPWGARKQEDGVNFDILDFCALKQLQDLRLKLRSYGREARFVFRLEDLSDRWLFGHADEIERYVASFDAVSGAMLNSINRLESTRTSWESFHHACRENVKVFAAYLAGAADEQDLVDIGWHSSIPSSQRDYYVNCYKRFYPNTDPINMLASYFAAVATRSQLKATCVPEEPFIGISFGHQIPGDPIARNRVYYRSLPCKYQHQHHAPWIGRGYLVIDDNSNEVTPRSCGVGEHLYLISNVARFVGTTIECNYSIR